MDQLELSVVGDLAGIDLSFAGEVIDRMRYLVTTNAAKAAPDRATAMVALESTPMVLTGDLQGWMAVIPRGLEVLVRLGCQAAPDPAMREWCTVLFAGLVGQAAESGFGLPGFDSVTGPLDADDGGLLWKGIQAYVRTQPIPTMTFLEML